LFWVVLTPRTLRPTIAVTETAGWIMRHVRTILALLAALTFCGLASPAVAQVQSGCLSAAGAAGFWRFEFTDNTYESWVFTPDGAAVGNINAQGVPAQHGTWTQSGGGIVVRFANSAGDAASMILSFQGDHLNGHYASNGFQGDIVGTRR